MEPLPPGVVAASVAVIFASLLIMCAIRVQHCILAGMEEEQRRERYKYKLMFLAFLVMVVISYITLNHAGLLKFSQELEATKPSPPLSNLDKVNIIQNLAIFVFAFVCLRTLAKCCRNRPRAKGEKKKTPEEPQQVDKVSVASSQEVEGTFCTPTGKTSYKTVTNATANMSRQTMGDTGQQDFGPDRCAPTAGVLPTCSPGLCVDAQGFEYDSMRAEHAGTAGMAGFRRRQVVWATPQAEFQPVMVPPPTYAAEAVAVTGVGGSKPDLQQSSALVCQQACCAMISREPVHMMMQGQGPCGGFSLEGQVIVTPLKAGQGHVPELDHTGDKPKQDAGDIGERKAGIANYGEAQGDQEVIVIKRSKDNPMRIDLYPLSAGAPKISPPPPPADEEAKKSKKPKKKKKKHKKNKKSKSKTEEKREIATSPLGPEFYQGVEASQLVESNYVSSQIMYSDRGNNESEMSARITCPCSCSCHCQSSNGPNGNSDEAAAGDVNATPQQQPRSPCPCCSHTCQCQMANGGGASMSLQQELRSNGRSASGHGMLYGPSNR